MRSKIILIIFTLLLIFTSCGIKKNSDTSKTAPKTVSSSEEKTENISNESSQNMPATSSYDETKQLVKTEAALNSVDEALNNLDEIENLDLD